MRKQSTYLILIAVFLGAYYLICGIYLNKLGYFNSETLFYIEKAKIILDGAGNRLKVMGLTAPILPFYATLISTFIFTSINYLWAPVIASAIGTALLFYIIATTVLKNVKGDFYLLILLLIFLLHPGILYTACSGKGIYLVLIFFYLFFLNLLKFYRSNTTFHVSVASICLVTLTFCDYRFIWLTLFFIPLILSISLQTLNLSEKESIFRLFLSFNSPSLRRKLVNKTFALYIIIFILPIVSILCYKLLNLSHANDLNYFIESPYATWNVLTDKLNYDLTTASQTYVIPDVSILISAKMILYCPLILFAIYLFKENTYQILTLLTPFAFIEFLHIKYDKIILTHEFYLIFLILSMLCIIIKSQSFKNQKNIKLIVVLGVLIQLYTGYYFLKNSRITDEQHFISLLLSPAVDTQHDNTRDIANYINSLPNGSQVLVDDAIAYPIIAFVDDIKKLTLPYQEKFLTAIEAPKGNTNYILIATANNSVTGYTQLNNKYFDIIKGANAAIGMHKVYETDDWILYKIM